MPVNKDIFDNIPIGQKPLIWPTVHCNTSIFSNYLGSHLFNIAEGVKLRNEWFSRFRNLSCTILVDELALGKMINA